MSIITLYGELYSKKNSKRILKNSKTGKPFIASSKAYEKSKIEFLYQLANAQNKAIWEEMKQISTKLNDGKTFPIRLNFKIYRKTRRQFDYNNIIQGLQDMMVEAGYLPDDSAGYLIPCYTPYEVDSKDPRIILSVD